MSTGRATGFRRRFFTRKKPKNAGRMCFENSWSGACAVVALAYSRLPKIRPARTPRNGGQARRLNGGRRRGGVGAALGAALRRGAEVVPTGRAWRVRRAAAVASPPREMPCGGKGCNDRDGPQ